MSQATGSPAILDKTREVHFDYRPGAEFVRWALAAPQIRAIVIFGPLEDKKVEPGIKNKNG